jgi:uncharacterized damage-inducible protein DinB
MQSETFFELAQATRSESVTACREFPPAAFDEEMVPGFLTFRKINQHILEAGYALTGMLLDGQEHFNVPEMRQKFMEYLPVVAPDATPEELASALAGKMEERIAQIRQAGPAFWEREVTHFSGARVTMMEMMLLVRQHEGEHRAQAAVLSRMCGIVPATTRNRLAAQSAAAK